jgi:hypothetical protein
MKNIFSKEFIAQFFIQIIGLGLVVFFVQSHYQNKWIPITAAETLKKENFLNSKRDSYFEALNILNRNLSNTDFTVDGVLSDTVNRSRGGKYPTELEVNTCFSKLCIYSENDSIPTIYAKLFDTNDKKMKPVLEMLTFVKLIRKDLGYGDTKIDSVGDRYRFITIRRPK